MEPKFQSSFIPKTQTQETAVPKEVERATGPQERGGFWSLIANSIFTLSVIVVILIFAGEWYLNKSVASMGDQLAAAREELQPERIQEINRAYDRINAVKSIIDNHVQVSGLFDKLQQTMVKNIRLTELSFNMLTGKGITLSFKGEANGYVTVAQQADIFNKQNFFTTSNFYDLSLNEQGAVLFSFKADIDPAIISLNSSTNTPTQ